MILVRFGGVLSATVEMRQKTIGYISRKGPRDFFMGTTLRAANRNRIKSLVVDISMEKVQKTLLLNHQDHIRIVFLRN